MIHWKQVPKAPGKSSTRKLRWIVVTFFGALTILRWLSVSSLNASAPADADAAASEWDRFTFGVVPQQSATELAKAWVPFCAYLSQKAGVKISYSTAPNIPEFEKRLRQGSYDFAYMNPYHFTIFSQSAGYKALGHEEGKRINGIIVVNKDSSVRSIRELQGKTLAFPSPGAFAASILTRSSLQRAGIDFKARYVSSHDSVYYNVARGFVDAGGGIPRTFAMLQPEFKAQLRILWQSPGYTPHAFAHRPGIPKSVLEKIKHALYRIKDTQKGKLLLKRLNMVGIKRASSASWNDIRGLKIDKKFLQ